MVTEDEVSEYAAGKGIIPGSLLWTSEKPLEEDPFRAGAKNHASVDFLRWTDIYKDVEMGRGRIPEEQWGSFSISPNMGISLFIKMMVPHGM